MTAPPATRSRAAGVDLPAQSASRASFARNTANALWLASSGVLALVVYSATLARDLTWQNGGGDGAELATAAYVGGVAHPPGYPLYLSALWLAQLAPFGDVALRSNAFSALAAAGAAIVLNATLTALLASPQGTVDLSDRIGACFGAAVFSFAPLIWSQALITEVYTFEVFLFSLFLLALVGYCRQPSTSRLVLMGVSLGLLISHHLPFALALLPLAWVVRAWHLDWRTWLLAFTLPLVIALLVLASVALRASFQPWLSWGDAVTLGAWFAHVTGASYQSYWLSATPTEHLQRAVYAVATLVRQGGWLATGLAALGFSWLWQRWRPVAVMCFSVGALFIIFAVLYNARDGLVYLAPAVTVLALGAGLGAAWLLRLAPRNASLALTLVLAASVGWQVVSGWAAVDVARDTLARDWATQRLASVPPRGIVHVEADEQLFTLWYLQAVEGTRADVLVVDDRLLATPWYCRQLQRQHPDRFASNQSPSDGCRDVLSVSN